MTQGYQNGDFVMVGNISAQPTAAIWVVELIEGASKEADNLLNLMLAIEECWETGAYDLDENYKLCLPHIIENRAPDQVILTIDYAKEDEIFEKYRRGT